MTAAITFFKKGDMFLQGVDTPSQRYDRLPGGIYLIGASMEAGFFLKELPDFELPKRLYGTIQTQADRILGTFADRPRTTGVLLSGEKGSGKTLLTQKICMDAAHAGVPTIVVNAPFGGDQFNTFLQTITQPCILLFDEFEKVYDQEAQQSLLTLFDGIFTTKKLILLTSNDYMKVNNHLQNRPGRIYYNLEFNGLDHGFIMEYGQENLKDKAHLAGLGVVSSMVKPMSFDILKAIVEECNRYGESPVKTMEYLNVKEYSSYTDTYVVKMELKSGKKFTLTNDEDDDDNSEVRCNPFRPFRLDYYLINEAPAGKGKKKSAEDALQYVGQVLQPESLTSFDGMNGIYTFETKDAIITLTRKPLDKSSTFSKYEHLAL